jgi:hypothetical protein
MTDYFSDREAGPRPRTAAEVTPVAWGSIVIAIKGRIRRRFLVQATLGHASVATTGKYLYADRPTARRVTCQFKHSGNTVPLPCIDSKRHSPSPTVCVALVRHVLTAEEKSPV